MGMFRYTIGIDDTNNLGSHGTDHLARMIASALALDFHVRGVTRHQFLDDTPVPKTAKNSYAAIHFEGDPNSLEEIAPYARKLILDDFQPGSE